MPVTIGSMLRMEAVSACKHEVRTTTEAHRTMPVKIVLIIALSSMESRDVVILHIRIIRRIVINAYFYVLNKSGRIIRCKICRIWPIWGLSRHFPPQNTAFLRASNAVI
jgi:hypothetical protein